MINKTGIEGLYLIQPKVFTDQRGYFFESFNARVFEQEGIRYNWVQDNESFSTRGVLRGLHYQVSDHAQAKLVRVIEGRVLDVVVDLRPHSPTYGRHFSEILSDKNKWQMLIPRGFAHGFIVLSESAIFNYKCDRFYHRESEGSIHPLDPKLKIDWILTPDQILLSEKDKNAPYFDHRLKSGQ